MAGPTVELDLERQRRVRFAWVGAALFCALGLVRAWYHEPWRDECGVWLLGQNCSGLRELVHYLRYGGHPFLWPMLGWLVARTTTQIYALQAVHLLLATGAVFLVLRFAPWPRWEAALAVLGYYFFFEYAIICRAYVLALLGVTLVALAWQQRGRRAGIGGAGLFLLALSSIYGLILALAFIPVLSIVALGQARSRTLSAGWCFGWLAPLGLGASLALLMMWPHADAGFSPDWHWQLDGQRLDDVLATGWRGLVPLPDPQNPFLWNSNIADPMPPGSVAVLGALAFALALVALRRDLLALLFFLSAATGILAFEYVKYVGYLRHHGHFYLAFFLALWMTAARRGSRRGRFYLRRGWFLAHAVAGFLLAVADWSTPFSANQLAARWIATGNYTGHLLVGHWAHAASGVGMWLRRPIYYLQGQRLGTFIIWDNWPRLRPPGDPFQEAANCGRRAARPVLLILNEELPEREGFRLQARFTQSLIADERFFLYTQESGEPHP
jgi:hypothetical protein